ncbi:MAG TPA: DoxX family protein [Alphaproteobacteria bacterium]|nr:DoxX family protein [Alphaproteobacteria bacterium]
MTVLPSTEPRLFIPALAPLYAKLRGLGYPIIRIAAGLLLLPHGAQKLFGWFGGGGIQGTAGFFTKMGIEPAVPMVVLAGAAEFFGGILLVLGLLTRPAALAVFILMMVAVFKVHLGAGFFAGKGGYEFALLWGLVALGIALRGGGPLSLDRKIGREF